MSILTSVDPALLFAVIVIVALSLVSLTAVVGLGFLCYSFFARMPAAEATRALALTSLLFIIDCVWQLLYDLGGHRYFRFTPWVTIAWTLLSLMWLVSLGLCIYRFRTRMSAGRFRALVPVTVYAVGTILFVGLWMRPGWLSLHGDAVMIRHFHRHEAEFNRLSVMREQDGQRVTICPRAEARQAGVDAQRLAEYDKLLGQTGVHEGVARKRDHIQFRYWAISTTEHKGYAFSREALGPLVESIDGQRYQREGVTYRQISDSWYLYSYFHNSMADFCY